uniref:Nitric oxide synthase, inducible n=1 Tax=Electrophorus electricus TaxID=8005 RepID=A0AAY5ET85_ELEEL
MFEYLCAHIKFATDGGNIRSTITVFPQRTDGQHDFRIWNSQLIRYAGYQIEDGTVIGDPVNVEFTEICTQLGWTPKYGSFDVLPLILEANGEDPELFEIPPELVLEVQMEHPRYEWFKELNLRWYALPAVANMLLEIGGLEFTACPFNGWYMSTEIGVRDFCDPQRYNIVERVGRCMGLETHRLSSLWKDEALVAINIAVIHSFQKNKVTIIDHHSATESFMHHMENEVRLRGGCPADWIWLVPPMSGSLTPVFHQEMISYILSPFFYYQTKGLKNIVVLHSLPALMKRVPCTILYATETGKSQTFAKKLKSVLSCALNPRLLCMEDYNFAELEKEHLLLVVTSTFGNGDSPGNGESFKKQLTGMKSLSTSIRLVQKDIKRIKPIFRTGCVTNHFPPHRYGVFGLGSRMYPQFCAFSRTVDAKLAELGAKCVTSTGEGDELNGQEEAFSAWACTAFKVGEALVTFNCNETRPHSAAIAFLSAVLPLTLKWRKNLHSSQSRCSAILVELETAGEKQVLNYAPGDHVGVFPENSSELVTGILKQVTNAPPTNQSLRLENLPASSFGKWGVVWQTDERIPACTLTQALTYLLDINTPPSQGFLRKLSQMTKEQNDQQRLLALALDLKAYSDWKAFRRPNFLEVLEEFPSLELSAAFLLSHLPLLKPRLYSISSSPDLHPHELDLTVSVINYRTQDGKGPLHHGVCSTWLNTMKEGQFVPCFIHRSNDFHLPSDPCSPILLIGAGSGIAPFRSFWQQRFYDMEKTGLNKGPMMLVFGCCKADIDHLYKEETFEMKEKGILKSISVAYSCQPGHPKVYVQHVLKKQLSKEVMQVLHQSRGHLYVCGGMNMAQDVAHTIQEILARRLGTSLTQAQEYLEQLKVFQISSCFQTPYAFKLPLASILIIPYILLKGLATFHLPPDFVTFATLK